MSFTFIIFGYTHTASYFNLIFSFIFQPIPSLKARSVFRQSFNLKCILYHLKMNSDGITIPCHFTSITTSHVLPAINHGRVIVLNNFYNFMVAFN